MALLEISGLDVFYGRAQILFGLELQAEAGEVVALLGRNGAGKSTTLKTVMGLVHPRAGEILYNGTSIARRGPSANALAGIGYVPEERRIFSGLTVQENLQVGRQPPREGLSVWTKDRLFALFPNLAGLGDRSGGAISGGEQQMLTVARALMGNPRLLLLDEPSEGLAPVIIKQMAEAINVLKGEGLTIILSEQNIHFARAVADRAYIIERGHISVHDTMANIEQNEALRRKYLAL